MGQERPARGAGIGLSVGRGIIHAHGGEIAVTSALDRGTVFRVTLPLAPASPPDPAVHARAHPIAARPPKTPCA